MLVAILVPITGCFFTDEILVTVEDDSIIITIENSLTKCKQITFGPPPTFQCNTFGIPGTIRMGELGLTFFLVLVDPLILQVPDGANNFMGTFSGTAAGSLDITPGLGAIPADANQTLFAEPGMQLVIFDLPPSAPIPGTYAFEVHFDFPTGLTELPVKGMFTGRVESGGNVFYPPLFPCTTDFAALPEITVPVSADGTFSVPLPVGSAMGCDNELYLFGALPSVPIFPRSGPIVLSLLLIVLLAFGVWRLSRNPETAASA